ncbi:12226_t:CDS:2, partial [Funneliformis mosseae]
DSIYARTNKSQNEPVTDIKFSSLFGLQPQSEARQEFGDASSKAIRNTSKRI